MFSGNAIGRNGGFKNSLQLYLFKESTRVAAVADSLAEGGRQDLLGAVDPLTRSMQLLPGANPPSN